MEQSGACPGDVLAVGVDGQMAGVMGVDAHGEASTVYDCWLDTRCAKYMDIMNEKKGERIITLSGGPVTYIHGPKILWLKHEWPEVYKKTCKFVMPNAYVAGKMAGLDGERAYFDHTHLHFSTFGDNLNKTWSEEVLEAFDIDKGKMARIVSPFNIVGHVTPEFARLSGLISGIPVAAGCGDTAASTFGAGLFTPGMTLDCAGTASVLCSVADSFAPDVKYKTITMMRSPIDGLWLPLAYINGGGLCLRWLRDLFSQKDYKALEALSEDIAPGSEGLLFLPHFSGRVLPNDPNLKGAFFGLDFSHTKAHLFKSAMKGIACEYAYYLSVLHRLYPGAAFDEMLSIGGGSGSPVFNQLKADVLGVRVTALETGETALLGSAVIAGAGAGVLPDYRQAVLSSVRRKLSFSPDLEKHEAYGPVKQAYLKALDSLSGFYRI